MDKVEDTNLREHRYLDILQILRILLVNLWVIVLVTIIGSVVVYLVVDLQTDIYESESSIVILPASDSQNIPRPIENINIAVGTYLQVIRSRNLNNSVIEVLNSEFDPGAVSAVELNARPIENSSLIVIAARSSNPELAQRYSQELIDLLLSDNPIFRFEEAYTFDVLDQPTLPRRPIIPNKRASLVLGVAGSIIAGVMLAFLRDAYINFRQNRLQTKSQIKHSNSQY